MYVCARVFEGSVEKEVYLTIKVIIYIVSILYTKKRQKEENSINLLIFEKIDLRWSTIIKKSNKQKTVFSMLENAYKLIVIFLQSCKFSGYFSYNNK